MENEEDEDEEPLEAEVPRARTNQKSPTSRRNKNMKIQDMLCTEVGVLLVSNVEELVDYFELKKRNEKS